ncbi:MAG: flagellar export chaperone FliS [Rickettsiales bacterium]|nr:flagellar export chaperone FliS [Rickettsiales bacterium]
MMTPVLQLIVKDRMNQYSHQKHKYQAYASATQTVAKTKQIVMLYDGVVRFMQQAKEAMAAGRIEERYHLLIKVSSVLTGLQGALDFEKGGEVAKVLYSFYSSVDNRVFSLHRTNSIETCEEVIADLKQMRDVWFEIDQSTNEAASAEMSEAQEADMSTQETTKNNITLSA